MINFKFIEGWWVPWRKFIHVYSFQNLWQALKKSTKRNGIDLSWEGMIKCSQRKGKLSLIGHTCLYVSIEQRVSTSRYFGVKPSRTTLSDVANIQHIPHTNRHVVYLRPNKALLQELAWYSWKKKANKTPTSSGYCFSSLRTSCSFGVKVLICLNI